MITIGTILTILSLAVTGYFAWCAWCDRKYGKIACIGLVLAIMYIYFEWNISIGLASFVAFIPFFIIGAFLPYKEDCPYKPTYKGMSQNAWLQLQFDRLNK